MLHRYHFDLGNNFDGPVGFCAAVDAETPEEAVEILKANLPEEEEVVPFRENSDDRAVDYCCVYFNDEFITVANIDEIDDVPVERASKEPAQ